MTGMNGIKGARRKDGRGSVCDYVDVGIDSDVVNYDAWVHESQFVTRDDFADLYCELNFYCSTLF